MPLRVATARFAASARPFARPLVIRPKSRWISSDEKPLPKADKSGPGPNEEPLPSVSEEAAHVGCTMGKGGPELEQGTPVQEILKREQVDKEKIPKVLKDENMAKTPDGKRSFSTSTRTRQAELTQAAIHPPALEGHKFGIPTLPIPSRDNLKFRYDPMVKQVTGLIMKDGKLARAQNNMTRILNILRTSPAPKVNPKRPLLSGAPPASHLPLNPILYLTLAIDSVAPLLRIQNIRGIAGGGNTLPIPKALAIRQRRRTAVKWILEAVNKKKSRGSGKGMFAQKVADELIAIVEGRSSVWERRNGIHRQCINARANFSKLRPRY